MDRNSKLASLVRNRRGQAVVEMALVLPLLLFVVFGITEFGRAWMTVNIMHTAVREGVRLAVVTGPDEDAVIARVEAVMNSALVTPKVVTVAGPDATLERKVTVTATSDFTVLSAKILFFTGMSGTFELSASTTMRHESF